MKIFLLFLIILMAPLVIAETCVIGNGSSSSKECLINQDLNVFELMTFDGNLTDQWDLNLTIFREESSSLLIEDQDMVSYTAKEGLFFYEVVGGYPDSGEYLVFITGEHLALGSPDGNTNSVSYNFTLLDSDVQSLIEDTNRTLLDAILGKIKAPVIAFSSEKWEGQNQGQSQTSNVEKVDLAGLILNLFMWAIGLIVVGLFLGVGVWYAKRRFFD